MDNLLWRRAVEKQETKANIEKTKEQQQSRQGNMLHDIIGEVLWKLLL